MLRQLDDEVEHDREIQHQHTDEGGSHAANTSSFGMAWIVVHAANSPTRLRFISNV